MSRDEPAQPGGRADALASRRAVLGAGAEIVRRGERLTVIALAARAGLSRSTVYRHFGSVREIEAALRRDALGAVTAAINDEVTGRRPPLAELRSVVSALVDVGPDALPVISAGSSGAATSFDQPARQLDGLIQRLATAAGLIPAPVQAWRTTAGAHLIEACLRTGLAPSGDRHDAAERLVRSVTDPLDRGLLLVDPSGRILAANDVGPLLARDPRTAIGADVGTVLTQGSVYDDGSPAPAEAHPVLLSLRSGRDNLAIRGVEREDAGPEWYEIDVRALRRAGSERPYCFVAICTDVTAEHQARRAHLRPPGQLGASAPPLLDIVRALDEVPPPLLPEQLTAEAARIAGGPVALYVLDIDGSRLLRLAGREDFPAELPAPLALGPELAQDGLPELSDRLTRDIPGVVMAPMWLRGRAVGLLLALRGSHAGLQEVARLGAAAMELANGYTDEIDGARRSKPIDPAAEIQQSLLPPRIAKLGSGEIAGSVLPSYDVGGDWFDYVDNRDGAWLAIGDAAGRGARAAGLGSVALAALRAARRNGATLEQAAQSMHETVGLAGGPEFFMTTVLARWHPVYNSFSWINCGHPPPLLLRSDGTIDELETKPDLPLGVGEDGRSFRRHQRRLHDQDRLVMYSDGITRRRTDDGLFGVEGIARAAAQAGASATATAKAIQEAVVSASEDPLPDDAAVVVLAVTAGG